MNPEIATFLINVLNRQQLDVGSPDFEDVATLVISSKRALSEFLTPARD